MKTECICRNRFVKPRIRFGTGSWFIVLQDANTFKAILHDTSVLYFQGVGTILVWAVRALKEQEINGKSKVYDRYDTADTAMEMIVPSIDRALTFRALAMNPIKIDITTTAAQRARARRMYRLRFSRLS